MSWPRLLKGEHKCHQAFELPNERLPALLGSYQSDEIKGVVKPPTEIPA